MSSTIGPDLVDAAGGLQDYTVELRRTSEGWRLTAPAGGPPPAPD